jgi:hypothetical protein
MKGACHGLGPWHEVNIPYADDPVIAQWFIGAF